MAALRANGVPGKGVDFLYVDEAQDNLIIDAAGESYFRIFMKIRTHGTVPSVVLRALCPNPHGLFFAGDTAQTISVGSAFKFSELKSFLYRLEVSGLKSLFKSDILTTPSQTLEKRYSCQRRTSSAG